MSSPSAEPYDIVIVGAGPVGLLLSTCLARWGYRIKHIDNRAEPTPTGRADGIQPRSLDLLKNMGLKSRIMSHNPAKVFEVAFWDPTPKGIQRSGTWASCPDFVDARYKFTTLLHQGLIERVFIEDLERSGVSVQRPWTIVDFENTGKDAEYPVEVQLARIDAEQQSETVKAKYLFSGEGAKSFVRQKLGIGLRHKDPISHVWGVIDGVVRTDFPDIKMKCTIHSDAGSIMVIPREANMVRLYIQLASSSDPDFNPRKTATQEEVQEAAKKILKPYDIEWETIEWYSIYPIGQGIAEHYTLDERVFMGGDACHTHSPKAGQGMNAAFLDAQNLAWKIHHVECGFASRSILKTYESERKFIAENLLDFDARYAKLFSERVPSTAEIGQASDQSNEKDNNDAGGESAFIKMFKENCEFTSGYGVSYQANLFNWSDTHSAQSPLLIRHPNQTNLEPGRIFIPASVTRVVDANVVHLEQEVPFNGSFKTYLFCGDPFPGPGTVNTKATSDFAHHAASPNSFLTAFLRADLERVSHHELHNPHSWLHTFNVVFAARRADVAAKLLDARALDPLLHRYTSHVYADDVHDARAGKAEGIGSGGVNIGAAHIKMGLARTPAIAVVRPDGYVGCVVKLVEGSGTADTLNAYFGSFCGKKLGAASSTEQQGGLSARL